MTDINGFGYMTGNVPCWPKLPLLYQIYHGLLFWLTSADCRRYLFLRSCHLTYLVPYHVHCDDFLRNWVYRYIRKSFINKLFTSRDCECLDIRGQTDELIWWRYTVLCMKPNKSIRDPRRFQWYKLSRKSGSWKKA